MDDSELPFFRLFPRLFLGHDFLLRSYMLLLLLYSYICFYLFFPIPLKYKILEKSVILRVWNIALGLPSYFILLIAKQKENQVDYLWKTKKKKPFQFLKSSFFVKEEKS